MKKMFHGFILGAMLALPAVIYAQSSSDPAAGFASAYPPCCQPGCDNATTCPACKKACKNCKSAEDLESCRGTCDSNQPGTGCLDAADPLDPVP